MTDEGVRCPHIKKSKNLILTNLGGGISITVDIEVVPLCMHSVFAHAITRSNYTKHRFYRDRHKFSYQVHFALCICFRNYTNKIARGQVIVRYFTGLETVRLSIRVYVLTVPGSRV